MFVETAMTAPPSTAIVPHSREHEEAVIGAVLIDPVSWADCAAILTPSDFYIHRHSWIWDAFKRLIDRKEPLDFLTLSEELDRAGQLAEIGGPAYLTALINQTPTSLHAEAYALKVKEMATRRNMLANANSLATMAYDLNVAPELAIAGHQNEMTSLLSGATSGREVQKLGPQLSEVFDVISERSKNPKDVWGIPTGFPELDKETGGIHEGENTMLAGEPGVGKTWLALTWAYAMAHSAPGAFISLEMSSQSLTMRLLAGVSCVQSRRMKSGFMKDEDWPKLTNAFETLDNLPIYIDDRARDTASLRATLLRLQRDAKIRWFILDYMELLSDEGAADDYGREVSKRLTGIVKDLGLAGIYLDSVNGAGMDKVGSEAHAKSNISGSKQKIHDADNVLFLTAFDAGDNSTYSAEQKARMATLWCKKGRELENPNYKLDLIRLDKSPFWGEMIRYNRAGKL